MTLEAIFSIVGWEEEVKDVMILRKINTALTLYRSKYGLHAEPKRIYRQII